MARSLLLAALALQISLSQGFTPPKLVGEPIRSQKSSTQWDRRHCRHRQIPLMAAFNSKLLAQVIPPSAMNGGSLALAGKLAITMSKLWIGPAKAKAIAASVVNAIHAGDLVLIGFFGWALVPLCRLIYQGRHEEQDMSRFKKTYLYGISHLVSQGAKIGAVVYIVDLLAVSLHVMGFKFPYQMSLSTYAAQVLYTVWAATRLSILKQHLIIKAVKAPSREELGKASVYDRLLDALLVVATTLFILDILSVQTGRALQSVFALGSVGTLIFSLASKDLAAQFVNGLALSATGKFHEGEEIMLGDQTRGIVNKMGFMHTEIRGADEVIVKIPNSQLANQRVSNISRLRMSQVKQTLWFSYDDIQKIPDIIQDIKMEIASHCPKLIMDGTRPFRVHWRDFKEDHLEVVVDTHFLLPPTGNAYWDNRQQVLLAIAKAADKNNVSFDIPSLTIKTAGFNRPDLMEAIDVKQKMHAAMDESSNIAKQMGANEGRLNGETNRVL